MKSFLFSIYFLSALAGFAFISLTLAKLLIKATIVKVDIIDKAICTDSNNISIWNIYLDAIIAMPINTILKSIAKMETNMFSVVSSPLIWDLLYPRAARRPTSWYLLAVSLVIIKIHMKSPIPRINTDTTINNVYKFLKVSLSLSTSSDAVSGWNPLSFKAFTIGVTASKDSTS